MRSCIHIILHHTGLSGRGEMVRNCFLRPKLKIDTTFPRLKEDERAYIRARLEKDQGRSARERRITVRDVLNCFKDFKFFLGGFMYFGLLIPGKSHFLKNLYCTVLT